jgi:hypothetical protein
MLIHVYKDLPSRSEHYGGRGAGRPFHTIKCLLCCCNEVTVWFVTFLMPFDLLFIFSLLTPTSKFLKNKKNKH